MGEWTAELERLFRQKEYQYWEEQANQYLENQIQYFGKEGDIVGGSFTGKKEWDKTYQLYLDQVDAALDRDFDRSGQRDDELLEWDAEAEAARKEREKKALKQLEEEMSRDEEESENDDSENGDDQTAEADDAGGDGDEGDGDEEDDDSAEEDVQESERAGQVTGMPTEDDDFVGVVRRFWGGDGPVDPTDVEDSPRRGGVVGGEVPIEPWDSHDGIGAATKFYGGEEPTPPWEKIGPKFRPQAGFRQARRVMVAPRRIR